jgi:hypothetical protein
MEGLLLYLIIIVNYVNIQGLLQSNEELFKIIKISEFNKIDISEIRLIKGQKSCDHDCCIIKPMNVIKKL